MASPPRVGTPRVGGPRSGAQVSTPRLDATAKWLGEIAGTTAIDLGGVSELSQIKIQYGLEARGRPVLLVTPYMQGRAVAAGQRYVGSTRAPTKADFWRVVEDEIKGVVIERIANAGGDLAAVWSSKPLTKRYAAWKRKNYPGKPMGQLTGQLLSELRSTRSFVARRK